MSVLSIKLNSKLENMMQAMILDGVASNKAALVRKAIERLAEAEAVNVVLRAEKEVGEGTFLTGDLDDLIKNVENSWKRLP